MARSRLASRLSGPPPMPRFIVCGETEAMTSQALRRSGPPRLFHPSDPSLVHLLCSRSWPCIEQTLADVEIAGTTGGGDMKIRTGSVEEAVELAKRIPDFSNPYNLNSPDAVLPKLDHVLIAEQDGEPVGFRAGIRHSPDTFAVWLAGVLPEYRRQGIGGALYRSQKEWLKSQGYRFIRTHARNSNRVDAQDSHR